MANYELRDSWSGDTLFTTDDRTQAHTRAREIVDSGERDVDVIDVVNGRFDEIYSRPGPTIITIVFDDAGDSCSAKLAA